MKKTEKKEFKELSEEQLQEVTGGGGYLLMLGVELILLIPVRVENLTSSAIALASSISVFIRALQQEGFFNAKSRSRERFDMISDMSNPALQVVLKGVNPGGSDAA